MPLSILIWLPAAAALLGALAPRRGSYPLTGWFAFAGSVGALGITIGEIAGFDPGHSGLTHVTDQLWIAGLGIHYKLGLDGLNLFLVALTAVVSALAIGAANRRRWERPRLFFLYLGLAESAVLGALMAQDLILFVAFFDLMLIPFYFLTGQWGEENRVAATTKLVIYTLVGSLLMLAAAIATGVLVSTNTAHPLSFALSDLQNAGGIGAGAGLSAGSQEWIFLLFAAAFLVKMPAFPLHGWMPDGYRAMPLEALAIFSGVLSKVGAYGFLRIVLPLFPQASVHFQTLMLVIALASILYGSVMAFTQTNTRLILGYSSVAQLGFITLGIFALQPQGAQGAVLQMVNHGLVTLALFLIVGLLAARAAGSVDLRDMGGLALRAPVLSAIFLIVALATLAMPGSSNFVGEFLILLGVFRSKLAIAIVAFTGVVLASVYMLRTLIRAMHNRLGTRAESREIALADALALVPSTLVILGLSFYPQLVLHRSERSTAAAIAAARATAQPSQTARAPLAGASAPQPARTSTLGAGATHSGATR